MTDRHELKKGIAASLVDHCKDDERLEVSKKKSLSIVVIKKGIMYH